MTPHPKPNLNPVSGIDCRLPKTGTGTGLSVTSLRSRCKRMRASVENNTVHV